MVEERKEWNNQNKGRERRGKIEVI